MKHVADPRGVVVPLFDAAQPDDRPASAAKSRELLSRPRPLNPYREHLEFPDRWRAYLIAHFGTDLDRVAQAFGVSRRAARKWIDGEGGCKGGAVAIAVQIHPETAPLMLWAAE